MGWPAVAGSVVWNRTRGKIGRAVRGFRAPGHDAPPCSLAPSTQRCHRHRRKVDPIHAHLARPRARPSRSCPRFTRWLRPVVDAVARIDASVHRKLLFGFLVGAVLLVAMALLSLVVIGR